jgi:hypothetical protein
MPLILNWFTDEVSLYKSNFKIKPNTGCSCRYPISAKEKCNLYLII